MVYYVHIPSQCVYYSRSGAPLVKSKTYHDVSMLTIRWKRKYRLDMKLPDGI